MYSEQIAAPPARTIGTGWRLLFGWLLCGVTALLSIITIYFIFTTGRADIRDFLGLLYVLCSALTGAWIVSRRPANTVGWLMLAGSICLALGSMAARYGMHGALAYPGSLPHPLAFAWTASILTPLGTSIMVVLLPLVFPDGRLVSPAWRPAAYGAVVSIMLMIVLNAIRPGAIQDIQGLANPFALALPETLGMALNVVEVASVLGCFSVGTASLVARYRRSSGEEQLQLKWLTYAILAWTISVAISIAAAPFNMRLFLVADTFVMLSLAGIPLAIGVAVLRYRLYNIELLINRTLVYGALTVCIAGLYALIVLGLGTLLEARGNLLIGAAATGVVAVLFAPLRDQLQHGVNRLLYGARAEPYTALASLGRRLESTLAPEAVLPTIVETVAETLQLPYAAIKLRGIDITHEGGAVSDDFELPSRERIMAHYGQLPPSFSADMLVKLPLAYQSEIVAELELAPRTPGGGFSASDWQLLHDLARQAGAAVHAAQLTVALQAGVKELRRSRERLVLAQEEERRRIQRDLHDGLGPVLASMRMRLEACIDRAGSSTPELTADLERLDELVGQASGDIRRLVHDLRPPVLDQLGLIVALRQHAERFSRETAIDVQMSMPETLALPAAVEVTIFRIVQEALTNIHKHACADHVTLRLAPLGAALLLQIVDDGRGGATEGGNIGGSGIAGMRERAELLGGAMVLHSVAGSGTNIEVYLPIRRQSND